MAVTLYRCKHCGNIIIKIVDSKVPVVCCGEKMEELIPASVDAAVEKHVPVVTVDGKVIRVSVGSVEHPMDADHYIQWIYLRTEQGGQRKALNPGDAPHVTFCLGDDKAIAVYAYCNLHGLWMQEL